MTSQLHVINGPNLNLLGQRDPQVYGSVTLEDVERLCAETAAALGAEVSCFHSNHEGALIDRVHAVRESSDGLVVNLGAYTHTSLALMDALATCRAPVVEVHLSNVHAREEFRRTSYVSPVAAAVIAGAGAHGYALALHHLVSLRPDEVAGR